MRTEHLHMNETENKYKYVLIEDEQISKMYFEHAISRLRPAYIMSGEASSVKDIESVLTDASPDFIISGIRLSDGLSVDEFKRINCQLPTVFITSYSNLLTATANLNVVHSALKPVAIEELEESLQKVEDFLNQRETL